MKKIVLAYSGGVNTSAAISWLMETHRAEVITVTLDIGQGPALDDARERALSIGATRSHVIDAREEFARDFVLPALHAGAVYDGQYPLVSALARPLIAKHLVGVAHLEGATIVAHGCGDADVDHARMETAISSLDPMLTILAPAEEWGMTRDEVIAYARERGTPVFHGLHRTVSIDANLWGRSLDGGPLEDPMQEPAEDLYVLTESPASAPDHAAYVELTFNGGVPLAVNGVAMPLTELIASLETIAGAHGVGRIELIGRRPSGSASREIMEAPAAVVLHAAHKALQRAVTPRDLDRLATDLGPKYAELVDRGLWFTPTREASDALVAKVQERVTGTVRAKVFKGQCQIVATESPFAPVPSARQPRRMTVMGKK